MKNMPNVQNLINHEVQSPMPHSISRTCLAQEFGLVISHWPHNLKCKNPIARERLILRQLYLFLSRQMKNGSPKLSCPRCLINMCPAADFFCIYCRVVTVKNLPDLEPIWIIRKVVFIPVISLIYRFFCCSPLSLLIKGNNYL